MPARPAQPGLSSSTESGQLTPPARLSADVAVPEGRVAVDASLLARVRVLRSGLLFPSLRGASESRGGSQRHLRTRASVTCCAFLAGPASRGNGTSQMAVLVPSRWPPAGCHDPLTACATGVPGLASVQRAHRGAAERPVGQLCSKQWSSRMTVAASPRAHSRWTAAPEARGQRRCVCETVGMRVTRILPC